jgi:hypothetical protein
MRANNLQSQVREQRGALSPTSPTPKPKATNLFDFIYTAMHPPSIFLATQKRSTSKNK